MEGRKRLDPTQPCIGFAGSHRAVRALLSQGWSELSDYESPVLFSYQKTYPDGLDVLLTIEYRNGRYELWSSAESRGSGPARHKDSSHQDIESALKTVSEEMLAWDRD